MTRPICYNYICFFHSALLSSLSYYSALFSFCCDFFLLCLAYKIVSPFVLVMLSLTLSSKCLCLPLAVDQIHFRSGLYLHYLGMILLMPFENRLAVNTTPSLVSWHANPFPKVFQMIVNNSTVDNKHNLCV